MHQIVRYRMQDTGYQIPDAGYQIPDTGSDQWSLVSGHY